MRLKGINPFELHVEKAVVGAVAAAALGVLAWQFVGPPNRVMVKNNEVELDQAYPLLEREALAIQQKVRSDAPPPTDNIPKLDMLARWQARTKGPLSRSGTLAWRGETGRASDIPIASGPQLTELRLPDLQPPAPTRPLAATYLATIAPTEVADYPGLETYLPPQMPFDTAAVTVEAAFDGTAFRAMLEGDPDGDGPLGKMPEFWWSSGVQILDVQLHREELLANGQWGNPTIVAPIPGRESLREKLAKPVDAAALRQIVEDAATYSSQIRSPEYYQVVFGEDWAPPSERNQGSVAADRGRIDNLLRVRTGIEANLKRAEEDLAKVAADDKSAEFKRRNFQNRITELTRQLESNAGELRTAGHRFPDEAANAAVAPVAIEAPLLTNPEVRLWGHDLAVERGKTYRYRMVVALRNPLFGQRAALHKSSQSAAEHPVVLSQASEWSDPIRVDPDLYFFITSAQDPPAGQGIGGGPRASVEIYSFVWGYWRRATVSLEPGDPLVGELKVPDMAKARPDLMEDPRKPVAPNGPDGEMAPPVPPPAPVPNPAEPEKPVEIPTRRITVSENTFLLDVAAVPIVQEGGIAGMNATPQFKAFFSDSGGQIVVRSPDTERLDPAYQRVVASAAAGELELRPKTVKQNAQPRPGREKPEEGGGKTGGGG